ncbi:hypothetical protein OSSY52_02160 [Tepiditoga spiralis]|uniref:Uncharacterized protein n=1 Tax=Tepiditoga spiralis TaxID=2108365 RepID=A0A7G1G2J5_9BACT|nr:hypothetical protein OSSY52_02160 [Tepiditoga spiralis]
MVIIIHMIILTHIAGIYKKGGEKMYEKPEVKKVEKVYEKPVFLAKASSECGCGQGY